MAPEPGLVSEKWEDLSLTGLVPDRSCPWQVLSLRGLALDRTSPWENWSLTGLVPESPWTSYLRDKTSQDLSLLTQYIVTRKAIPDMASGYHSTDYSKPCLVSKSWITLYTQSIAQLRQSRLTIVPVPDNITGSNTTWFDCWRYGVFCTFHNQSIIYDTSLQSFISLDPILKLWFWNFPIANSLFMQQAYIFKNENSNYICDFFISWK